MPSSSGNAGHAGRRNPLPHQRGQAIVGAKGQARHHRRAAFAAVTVGPVAGRARAVVHAAAGVGSLRARGFRREEEAQRDGGQAHGRGRYHRRPRRSQSRLRRSPAAVRMSTRPSAPSPPSLRQLPLALDPCLPSRSCRPLRRRCSSSRSALARARERSRPPARRTSRWREALRRRTRCRAAGTRRAGSPSNARS